MSRVIKTIVASTRDGRIAPQIADWLNSYVAKLDGVTAELLDLKEIDLPVFAESTSPMYAPVDTPQARAWSEAISSADGLVVLSPEYNRSYPAPLKNAIDFLFQEWSGKPTALVTYGFIDGGSGAAKHLIDIFDYLKMDYVDTAVKLHIKPDMLDDSRKFIDIDSAFSDSSPQVSSLLIQLYEKLSRQL
jgi:NAD(P)H-dependent FMN reductase